jgi:hypothetical protein
MRVTHARRASHAPITRPIGCQWPGLYSREQFQRVGHQSIMARHSDWMRYHASVVRSTFCEVRVQDVQCGSPPLEVHALALISDSNGPKGEVGLSARTRALLRLRT